MNKKGAIGWLVVLIVVIVLVIGGYFGYKALFSKDSTSSEKSTEGDFGYGIWSCEVGGLLGGSHPIIGYGGGEITGIEIFDLPTVGEINLCCIEFENLDNEKYKVCLKKNDEGFTTHEIALDGDKKVYEIVPWQGLSCTYIYDDKGDWTRSCE